MSHTSSLLINQDIFFRMDVSQSGTLPLKELRNAITATGESPDSPPHPAHSLGDGTQATGTKSRQWGHYKP